MSLLTYWTTLIAGGQLLVVCLVLLGSLSYQFLLGELPCPLCVLQRVAFLLACVGPIGILRRSPAANRLMADARDFACTIFASLLGFAISVRQIFLHIVPPDAGYGPPVMGFHLYTWAAFVFLCLIGSSAAGLLRLQPDTQPLPKLATRGLTSLILVIAVIIATATFAMEGFNFLLPDDPGSYQLFR